MLVFGLDLSLLCVGCGDTKGVVVLVSPVKPMSLLPQSVVSKLLLGDPSLRCLRESRS